MAAFAVDLGPIRSDMTDYQSKHGIVSRQPAELYMSFTDLRNFLNFLPEDKKQGVTADSDSLTANVQGFELGVSVEERVPYSRILFKDNGGPFPFRLTLHFDPSDEPGKTDFHIDLSAELNLMMQMFLGSKLQGAMDKLVDGLVDAANGKVPEGFDPSKFGMHV